MWLFMQNGFLSVVADRSNPDRLLVRARVRGDIEKFFPGIQVEVDAGSDYKYRAFIRRIEVASVLANEVKFISYDNYKANVTDRRRLPWYARIWEVMADLQDVFHRKGRMKE